MTWVALVELIALIVLLIWRRETTHPPLPEMLRHSCGASNPQGANYCRQCGAALTGDIGLTADIFEEQQ